MRPTRWGWAWLLMTALALASAGASGNNLLYLLYGALASAWTLAALVGIITLRRLRASAWLAGPAVKSAPALIRLLVVNRCPWPVYGWEARWGASVARFGWVAAGGQAQAALRIKLPHRGLNRLEGLTISGAFPFSLWSGWRPLAVEPVLAWPAQRPVRDLSELGAETRPGGRPLPRKGGGEEIHGLRDMGPDDDSRAIHWKLTARAGRPIVADYGSLSDPRLIVRVPPGAEGDERLIEEAASACRFAIDGGGEVALEAGGRRLDFGRGLGHLEKILEALALLGEGARPRHAPAAGVATRQAADLRIMRWLTLLAAAAVYLAMGLIDETSARLAWLGLPALALGAWAQAKDKQPLPSWAWTALSTAILVWTAAFDWRLTGVAVANIHLVGYLLCYRILVPIKEEELGQALIILFLGFFLASGLTISLWYFAPFLLFGLSAAAWLAGAAGAPRERWRQGAWPLVAAAALALALAACFFVLTPRGDRLRRMSPLLAAGIDKLSAKPASVIGFTDTVSLGGFGELKKSSARIMRVSPVGWGSGRPGALYVRGSALEIFDGRRWTHGDPPNAGHAGGRTWAQRGKIGLVFPIPGPRGASPAMDFNVYPMNLNVLFTVGTPWLVEGVDDLASFDLDDSIKVAAPYVGGLRYREFFNPSRKGFSEGEPAPTFLETPSDPGGRVAALAAKAVAGASSPQDKVRAIELYLQEHYVYSLYSDGRDRGLDDFLFRARKGNCEYFASAAAVLLRHEGVPARLATGFLADEWNEYGRFFDVRQNEAHAWVEAWLPGRGWTLSDPTPAQGLLSASADAFGKRMVRWFEAAQTEWYRHIIGYDQYVQNDALRRLGGLWSARNLEGALRRLLRPTWEALGLLALVLGAAFLKARLKRAPVGAFARAQALLARAGLSRAAHWTPREFVREVLRRRPDLTFLDALVELHYRACYSLSGLSALEREEEARLLRELRARL